MPQYQMPRPLPPILGASAAVPQLTTVLPVQQPDQARYAGLHANRFVVEAPKRFDGAVVHESYLFAIGQPQMRQSYQIPKAKAPIDVATVAVTQTDVFTSRQPDQARYAAIQTVRYLVPAPVRLEGATSQLSFVFSPNQPEFGRYSQLQALRFVVDAPKRIDDGAAAIVPQTYVFPLVQHYEPRWYLRRPIVDVIARPHEAAVAVPPQTYVFPLAQPELRAWLKFDPNRVPSGPTPQFTAATSQQTYLFPPNQPDQPRYALLQRARLLGGSVIYPLDTFAPAAATAIADLIVRAFADDLVVRMRPGE